MHDMPQRGSCSIRQPPAADIGIAVAHFRTSDQLISGGTHDWPGNVVPFVRPSDDTLADAAASVSVAAGDRPTEPRTQFASRGRFACLLVASFTLHAGLYAVLSLESPPVASMGEEAISIEIIVGTNSAAGLAERPSEQDADNLKGAETPIPERPSEPEEDTKPPSPPPLDNVAKLPESDPQVAETEPQRNEMIAELPPRVETRDKERDDKDVAQPQPADVAPEAVPRAPTVASSGAGRGHSAANARYQALVAAQLARHKRFPPDARNRRQQGSAIVNFTIDGNGQATSVQLVRGSGVAALDREAQAMVHRAAPFPPPPGRIAVTFTAPISFKLN
jgi:protein TonB